MSDPIHFEPVLSSFIDGAHYDATSKTMRVKFKSGKEYEYANVPSESYGDFAKTFQSKESSGKFLNSKLKQYAKK